MGTEELPEAASVFGAKTLVKRYAGRSLFCFSEGFVFGMQAPIVTIFEPFSCVPLLLLARLFRGILEAEVRINPSNRGSMRREILYDYNQRNSCRET
jgi:hypothetical protein